MNYAKTLVLFMGTLLLHGLPCFHVTTAEQEILLETSTSQTAPVQSYLFSHPALPDTFISPTKLLGTTPTPTKAPVPTKAPAPTKAPVPTKTPVSTEVPAPLNTDTSTYTFLVNKEYPLSKDYVPTLVIPEVESCYKDNNQRRYLQPVAATALEELFAAAAEDGFQLVLRNGYRSYQLQESIFVSYLKRDGYYIATRFHALGGTSEHQTGLAVDLCCEATEYLNNYDILYTEEYPWLLENAHLYGWILRYPENKMDITGFTFEPWHFRYVGVELATYLTEQNLTLEEYYGALPKTNMIFIPEKYHYLLSEEDYALMLEEQAAYQKTHTKATPAPTATPEPAVTPAPTQAPDAFATPTLAPDISSVPTLAPDASADSNADTGRRNTRNQSLIYPRKEFL